MNEIRSSKTVWISISLRLTLLALCLLAPASLWADKGNVTITNCGTEKVWIGSYDWGDTVLSTTYESSSFAVGDQHTLHCVKNWFTKNSPGCQIEVKAGTSGGVVLASWKVDNGTYTLGSVKKESNCSIDTTVCLKQQQACASDASANNSECLMTSDGGFLDTSCETADTE